MADRQVATMNMGSGRGEPVDLAAGVYANPAANAARPRGLGGDSGPVRPFAPAAVRYIKLGRNGKWAPDALKDGIIPFGYRAIDHHACLEGKWDEVRDQLVAMGRTAGWSRTSLSGEPLTVRSLSSDLSRTANYQMTICAIQRADYLLRRIRGEPDPLFEAATAVRRKCGTSPTL